MQSRVKNQINPSVHGAVKLDKANQEFDLWWKKNKHDSCPVLIARYIWNSSRGL